MCGKRRERSPVHHDGLDSQALEQSLERNTPGFRSHHCLESVERYLYRRLFFPCLSPYPSFLSFPFSPLFRQGLLMHSVLFCWQGACPRIEGDTSN